MTESVIKAGKAFSNDEIYARLQKAVQEHRLTPGTRLIEEKLGELAGVSRTKIREVLSRLSHEGLVTLVPNRGAFIASPSVAQARDVFVTRRMIEPNMASMLSASATPSQIKTLRKHSKKEGDAREKDDRPSIIRLSGEFHVLVAQMVGNEILLRMMRELTSLTCLIITLYDKPNTPACPHTEHAELIDAIEARDATRAAACMTDHLTHIEHTLNFKVAEAGSPDIDSLFE